MALDQIKLRNKMSRGEGGLECAFFMNFSDEITIVDTW